MLKMRYHSASEAITVSCDAGGMALLIRSMADLVGARASHLHLRGPGAGGSELDDDKDRTSGFVAEVILEYFEGD